MPSNLLWVIIIIILNDGNKRNPPPKYGRSFVQKHFIITLFLTKNNNHSKFGNNLSYFRIIMLLFFSVSSWGKSCRMSPKILPRKLRNNKGLRSTTKQLYQKPSQQITLSSCQVNAMSRIILTCLYFSFCYQTPTRWGSSSYLVCALA